MHFCAPLKRVCAHRGVIFALSGVGEEGEIEVVFVDELLVFFGIVGRDAEDDCVYFLEVGEVECGCLFSGFD